MKNPPTLKSLREESGKSVKCVAKELGVTDEANKTLKNMLEQLLSI